MTSYNLVSLSNIPIAYINIFFVWYVNINGDMSIYVLYHSRLRRKIVYSLLWRNNGHDDVSVDRWPHIWLVTRKMFPFDDVIM